jgi:hypothetical protein
MEIPLEPSHWNLLKIPFHNSLQSSVYGWIRDYSFMMKRSTRIKYYSLESGIPIGIFDLMTRKEEWRKGVRITPTTIHSYVV